MVAGLRFAQISINLVIGIASGSNEKRKATLDWIAPNRERIDGKVGKTNPGFVFYGVGVASKLVR